jgi:hypothetical protein
VLKSINFEFLREKWPQLADFGAFSEQYLYSDPQSSIIKLRCFIEFLVPTLYRELNLEYDKQWDLFSALRNQKFQDIIDEQIVKKFHAIRIKANKAIHRNEILQSDIEWLLKETYSIACWFYSVKTNPEIEYQYDFILPIETDKNKIDVLEQTIMELNDVIQAQQDNNRQIIEPINNTNENIQWFETVNKEVANALNLNDEEINERITLEEIYADYQLNSGQQELIKELDDFLKNADSHVFLLKGYAGTGKTFITKGFTEYLTSIGRKFILAAPTGKAAKVIKEKTKNEAFTIHKSIYSYKDLKEYKVENIDGTETFKFYFDLNDNTHDGNTVYIIDEASMVSDIVQEGEFFRFGSGRLLSDLMKYIHIDHNDHDKKIIFIGDTAQLPPIGMNFSPALNLVYLEKEFNLKCNSYELTEIMRQSVDSGIVENSLTIRESIRRNTFNQLDINLNFEDTQHVEREELMGKYLDSCGYKINGESIIIAHSNAVVDEYNSHVRKHFFPNQEYITAGDKVMAVANNGNQAIFIYNGDFGLIRKVDDNIIKREVFVREKINEELTITTKVPLWFRRVEIGFKNIDGKSYFFECLIFENILYRGLVYNDTYFLNEINKYKLKSRDINRLETVALYVDFVNRAREKGLSPNTEEFKQAIKSDDYFNSLKIKFGYALTCHKAQGSEWNNVFVNCKTHQNVLTKDYFRWFYTAITRTSKKLYLFDEPHIKPTSGMTRIGSIFDENVNDTIKESDVVSDDVSNLFGISPTNSFLVTLLKSVSENVKTENITIVDIQHNQYQEAYFFTDGQERCRINIYYNGKYEISNISPQNQDELSNKIISLLVSLNHKKIIVKPVNTVADTMNFNFSEPFLEEFYESLKKILEPQDIKIVEISSHPWLEKYLFTKNNDMATFDFYYNGKKQFTRFAEQPNKSTSVEFIRELNEILSNELK